MENNVIIAFLYLVQISAISVSNIGCCTNDLQKLKKAVKCLRTATNKPCETSSLYNQFGSKYEAPGPELMFLPC